MILVALWFGFMGLVEHATCYSRLGRRTSRVLIIMQLTSLIVSVKMEPGMSVKNEPLSEEERRKELDDLHFEVKYVPEDSEKIELLHFVFECV